MWRRARQIRGEDYTALAKKYPTPPATAEIVFDGDESLSEKALIRDFAGDLPEAKARVLYAVREPFYKALLAGKTTHAAGDRSRAAIRLQWMTARSIRTLRASWPSE